jgi:hypothetical protein
MAEQGRAQGRTQGYAGTWPPRDAARAGGIAPSGLGAWPSLIDKLRTWIRAEAGAGRLLPWVPVAFGTGIASISPRIVSRSCRLSPSWPLVFVRRRSCCGGKRFFPSP